MKIATNSIENDLDVVTYVGQMHSFDDKPGTFSPSSSALFLGKKDAVLVDAQHMLSDVEELIQIIANSGRRLTTIYVTHGHPDHWYGIGKIIRRFPQARAFATRAVLDDIKNSAEELSDFWRKSFGARAIVPDLLPELLEGPLEIEGHDMRIIELPQADISPTTAVFVPSNGTLVSGDALYNKIHMMLAMTGPVEWKVWLQSIDIVDELNPQSIICGHKRVEKPDSDARRIIEESRSYIQTFAHLTETVESAEALIEEMAKRFWDFGNLWTLQASASAYYKNFGNSKREG